MRVVVEPGLRTAAVAWQAPAKRSPALYLALSDDRSIAGGVAAAGIAATDCRHLVLQMLVLLVLLLWASQQQKEVVVHQSARKRLGRGDGVAKLCGQLNCVAHALAEGIQNVKQFFSWTKKKHVSIYAFTF